MANYVQPDFRNPITPGVTVQVENVTQAGAAAGNPLGLTTRVPYVQPNPAPAAPVSGQLADALGKSKVVHADGTSSST